ncbi:PAS domain S-box/diguanylate cyclase (GGDEF) domain-containing protein [Thermanaerovibrio velox DSM 12556]|uniref:PAS domain S-box/diguanylate cyclase (GGDEF) domain-containing protein n=1 Tax=Thermanaerovibrio velox DSM 12556 TaxID=926567 RepID=H0UN41_9BACT|nr:diguanylate cyclase [Thermanaerovibrio velox]EHM09320.1 PAS domain S-box/diguanylate cyclase (GGDEF) domain-containing protein [Thermanaerovibrio velox DSM 12556]
MDAVSLMAGFEDYIFVIDPEGRVLMSSPKAWALLKGKQSIKEILPPVYWGRLRNLMVSGKPQYPPMDIPLKKGSAEIPTEALLGRTSEGGRDLFVLSCRDISRIKRAEETLERSEERYHTIFDHSPLGIVHIDHDGIITDMNEHFLEIMGTTRERLIGINVIDNMKDPWMKKAILQALSGTPGMYEGRYTPFSGNRTSWIKAQFRPMTSLKGTFLGVVGVVEDISERREAEEQIRFLNMHDPLTGLLNRRCFDEELKRLDTPEHLPLCLIMGDVNGLKLANDAFGHPEGDLLLTTIAKILRESGRPGDLIFRWGGDEFILLLPRTGVDKAVDRVNRIHQMCSSWKGSGLVRPSISLGFGVKEHPDEDWRDAMLKPAEDLMYKMKMKEGRRARLRILAHLEGKLHQAFGGHMGLHLKRLVNLCEFLDMQLGMGEEDSKSLKLLCSYHDIGVVACKDLIDREPPVDEEALEADQDHPVTGYRIAKSIPELLPAADLILSHHERWDGGGYPQRLKGTDIPLPVRVFQVLDRYESLTNPDGCAMEPHAAWDVMARDKGRLYDPAILEAVRELLLRCQEEHVRL